MGGVWEQVSQVNAKLGVVIISHIAIGFYKCYITMVGLGVPIDLGCP